MGNVPVNSQELSISFPLSEDVLVEKGVDVVDEVFFLSKALMVEAPEDTSLKKLSIGRLEVLENEM